MDSENKGFWLVFWDLVFEDVYLKLGYSFLFLIIGRENMRDEIELLFIYFINLFLIGFYILIIYCVIFGYI